MDNLSLVPVASCSSSVPNWPDTNNNRVSQATPLRRQLLSVVGGTGVSLTATISIAIRECERNHSSALSPVPCPLGNTQAALAQPN